MWPKSSFQPLARIVDKRDERHLVPLPMARDVPPDLVVAAGVALLAHQPAKDLHRRVPLLRRGLFVVGQDLVDDRLEPPQLGGLPIFGPGIRLGSGLARASRTFRRE